MSSQPKVPPIVRAATVRRRKRLSAGEARLLLSAKHEASTMENRMFAEMYITALERKLYDSDDTLWSFLKTLEQVPVSIEEFLDSPKFLGAIDINIWPEVRKAIVDINKDWWRGAKCPTANIEALLCGATSVAKTTIAQIGTLYHIHLLGCMAVPQAYYGLPSSTSIVFPIIAAKPHVAKKVVYLPMRKWVETMPWFLENMQLDREVESEMLFKDKNIRVYLGGADTDTILGEAVIGGVIDEINFMNVILRSKKAEVSTGRPGVYDQAQSIYETMTRRKKGRFITPGAQLGIIYVSSSTRYKGDFTDRRLKYIKETKEPQVYVYNRKQYEVWPQDRYCGETFRLLVGNDTLSDTRVLKDGEEVPAGAMVLDVPIEYKRDFDKSPHDALRDIVGISTSVISPFFRRRFKINECVEAGEHEGLTSFLEKDNVVLGIDGMPMVKQGHYCANPSKPRYVHIDLSLNGDRCVAKGQQVLMANGHYKAIESVQVGDVVVTHKGTYEAVTRTFDNGDKQVLSVSVYGWPSAFRATATHKVWAVRRHAISYADGRLVKPSDGMFLGRSAKSAMQRYVYTPEFVELGSLGEGDFLVTPRRCEQEADYLGETPLTYGTGYIAGLFAAEGSYYMHHGSEYVQFSLHAAEAKIRRNLETYLKEYFGVGIRICRDKKSRGITVRTQKSDTLVRFLMAAVGEYSGGKHMDCAHIGGRDFHAGVAHGYVDGDGHVRYTQDGRPKTIKVKTVSPQMAFSFYWLLVSRGFMPSLGRTPAYTGKDGVHRRDCYHVSLSGVKALEAFFSGDMPTGDTPCSRAIALRDYILSPIVSLKKDGLSRVYDLTVGDTHSYIVGNTAVHNCGIAMVRFDGLRKVTRENDAIEMLPECTVELACSIAPDAQNEIDIAEVRQWVKALRDRYGYPIKVVTYDGQMGVESIQQWRKQGVKTGHKSVDRTSVPYRQFRDAINDTRIRMYHNELLLGELYELEYDENKDKIDHPVTGAKDIADAVCAAYSVLLERRASWTMAADDDGILQERARAEYDDRHDDDRY